MVKQYTRSKFLSLNVDCVTTKDETPIFLASSKSQLEINPSDRNHHDNSKAASSSSRSSSGRGASNDVIEEDLEGVYEEMVSILIAAGANVNLTNSHGQTPLHIASQKNYAKIVRLLIDAGANVNLCDEGERSAIWMAAAHGAHECVEILIEANANIDHIIPQTGETPLMIACRKSHTETVKVLAAFGADVNMKANNDKAPIHIVVDDKSDQIPLLKLLIDAGADVNLPDRRGQSPLWLAATRGRDEYVDVLAHANADIDAVDRRTGTTALLTATDRGLLTTVQRLLSCGADVNVPNLRGDLAMHVAARKTGCADILRVFIDADVDVNVVNQREDTPLTVACRMRNVRGVEVLLTHESIDLNTGSPLMVLLSSPPSLFLGDDQSGALVEEIACRLVQADCHVNVRDEESGWTPLFWACKRGYTRLIGLLVEHGACVHSVSWDGLSLLETTVSEFMRPDMAVLLKKYGVREELDVGKMLRKRVMGGRNGNVADAFSLAGMFEDKMHSCADVLLQLVVENDPLVLPPFSKHSLRDKFVAMMASRDEWFPMVNDQDEECAGKVLEYLSLLWYEKTVTNVVDRQEEKEVARVPTHPTSTAARQIARTYMRGGCVARNSEHIFEKLYAAYWMGGTELGAFLSLMLAAKGKYENALYFASAAYGCREVIGLSALVIGTLTGRGVVPSVWPESRGLDDWIDCGFSLVGDNNEFLTNFDTIGLLEDVAQNSEDPSPAFVCHLVRYYGCLTSDLSSQHVTRALELLNMAVAKTSEKDKKEKEQEEELDENEEGDGDVVLQFRDRLCQLEKVLLGFVPVRQVVHMIMEIEAAIHSNGYRDDESFPCVSRINVAGRNGKGKVCWRAPVDTDGQYVIQVGLERETDLDLKNVLRGREIELATVKIGEVEIDDDDESF